MGWFPSKVGIKKEVNDYKKLGFFGKSKNLLVSFIIITAVISYFVYFPLWIVLIYFFLGIFIYLNHRWAIAIFATGYLAEKLFLVVADMVNSSLLPLLYGVIVTIAAYRSFCVATQLKKNAAAKVD
jgi:predicted membrane protein